MKRNCIAWWAAALLVLGLGAGCASGIGDACGSSQDCGGRTCETTNGFSGGYCTQPCIYGDASTCPGGSSCVNHQGQNLCLRGCKDSGECRSGHTCKNYKLQGMFCLAPGDE